VLPFNDAGAVHETVAVAVEVDVLTVEAVTPVGAADLPTGRAKTAAEAGLVPAPVTANVAVIA